ncbi:uncharacterized protein LOC129717896 [Wyeomyia smithii]|uniref:uncharacterized protein LOC129717896 n=1 Tax=Wyeomyia smithii TaxID=174621 RepID=UPI002467E306|nr:uncharacterized protein LOC129717896 [Wyeomyia smithii]
MAFWKYQILAVMIVFTIGEVLMADVPIPGGPQVIPVADLKKDEHVKRVAGIFTASSGHKPTNPEILSGVKQTVQGVKYVYTVSFKVNDVAKKCKVSVLERPWLAQTKPKEAYVYENKC